MMSKRTSYEIAVVSSGSRGDVQPYIALALALKERGHRVRVVSEKRMESLVTSFQLDFHPIEGDPTGMLFEPSAQDVLRSGSIFSLIRLTEEWDKKFDKRAILNSYVKACDGCEIIVSGGLSLTQTYCVAEATGATWIPAILGPTLPTSEFPLWALSSVAIFSCLNKWTYNLAFSSLWTNESKFINPWRQESLHLPVITSPKGIADIIEVNKPPIIIMASPVICPNRRIPGDYPYNAYMTGFVQISADESSIAPEVLQFFSEDATIPEGCTKNIVYFGFGSMPTSKPEELLSMAVEVCKHCKCRGVVVAGWSQLNSEACLNVTQSNDFKSHVLVAKDIPHAWLFPRVQCVVHHCGIGTMAAALKAGVPQVPCPVMLDQPHNANTLVRLQCAPAALPFKSLNSRSLSNEIHKCLANDNVFARNAQIIGIQVAEEMKTAITQCCTIIEENHQSDVILKKIFDSEAKLHQNNANATETTNVNDIKLEQK